MQKVGESFLYLSVVKRPHFLYEPEPATRPRTKAELLPLVGPERSITRAHFRIDFQVLSKDPGNRNKGLFPFKQP